MVLAIGSTGYQVAVRMLGPGSITSPSPGLPRHVFFWKHESNTDDADAAGDTPSTRFKGTASEAAATILATSRMILHPTRPPVPELDLVPESADVVVVGAGLTGIYVAQQFVHAGVLFLECLVSIASATVHPRAITHNAASQVTT